MPSPRYPAAAKRRTTSLAGGVALAPACVLALAASASFAAAAQDFPAGATTPLAADVERHLSGKTFTVAIADGSTWRLEYRANGYFFINTSRGFNNSGQWQAEDGRLCSRPRSSARSCNEVRLVDSVLQLKRDNGEIVQFVEK